ncbi:MAG: dNTP triphosphohydrolase [Sphingobacteriales bacterium]|nr:dNTP triphosphohydrolase [Sphingobacteriales bacterium]
MNWINLLGAFRHGDQLPRVMDEAQNRSIFEQDYDRIIFSTPFRRLQDKTQVIPLPEYDFVHNRLTHSIEVSSVGRTLGKMVGTALLEKYPALKELSISHHDFGAIVAAASLAHDIGNPPFGHSGESAISEYFLNGLGAQYQSKLSESEWNDITRFEGNANGFRILTNASNAHAGGLRLSYPTLAAFTKYPKESLPILPKGRASEKKFGFFQSEQPLFEELAVKLGLMQVNHPDGNYFRRHPLAFLVEAADDICYHIIDFEDGLRMQWIDFEWAEKLLLPIAGNAFYRASYEAISLKEEKASYLRAVAINSLINEMAELFLKHEAEILKGEFDTSLLHLSAHKQEIDQIKAISLQKVYKAKQVIEIEAAGFEVIGGLLDLFLQALQQLCKSDPHKTQYKHKKIAELLPAHLQSPKPEIKESTYLQIISVCEFVAGLTDRHAISLYRKLKGIELPN